MDNKRWNTQEQQFEDSPPEVEAFLKDLETVCRKHNMSLGHEDVHGAFIIGPFSEYCIQWLRDAHYNPPPKEKPFPFKLP